MYFPDRGCVRPLRNMYGYATALDTKQCVGLVEKKLIRTQVCVLFSTFSFSVFTLFSCRFPCGRLS